MPDTWNVVENHRELPWISLDIRDVYHEEHLDLQGSEQLEHSFS